MLRVIYLFPKRGKHKSSNAIVLFRDVMNKRKGNNPCNGGVQTPCKAFLFPSAYYTPSSGRIIFGGDTKTVIVRSLGGAMKNSRDCGTVIRCGFRGGVRGVRPPKIRKAYVIQR